MSKPIRWCCGRASRFGWCRGRRQTRFMGVCHAGTSPFCRFRTIVGFACQVWATKCLEPIRIRTLGLMRFSGVLSCFEELLCRKARLFTPKAFHNTAQGRASAPWERHPLPPRDLPEGVVQRASMACATPFGVDERGEFWFPGCAPATLDYAVQRRWRKEVWFSTEQVLSPHPDRHLTRDGIFRVILSWRQANSCSFFYSCSSSSSKS
jgi:hypothetical protein